MEVLRSASGEIQKVLEQSEKDKSTWDMIGKSSLGLAGVGLCVLGAICIVGTGGAALGLVALATGAGAFGFLYAKKKQAVYKEQEEIDKTIKRKIASVEKEI